MSIQAYIYDIGNLARHIEQALSEAEAAVPSHLKVMNAIAKAAGHQNYQAVKAHTEGHPDVCNTDTGDAFRTKGLFDGLASLADVANAQEGALQDIRTNLLNGYRLHGGGNGFYAFEHASPPRKTKKKHHALWLDDAEAFVASVAKQLSGKTGQVVPEAVVETGLVSHLTLEHPQITSLAHYADKLKQLSPPLMFGGTVRAKYLIPDVTSNSATVMALVADLVAYRTGHQQGLTLQAPIEDDWGMLTLRQDAKIPFARILPDLDHEQAMLMSVAEMLAEPERFPRDHCFLIHPVSPFPLTPGQTAMLNEWGEIEEYYRITEVEPRESSGSDEPSYAIECALTTRIVSDWEEVILYAPEFTEREGYYYED